MACNSGALTALDAENGSVRRHTELEVDGVPTTALSLVVARQGHLLIGTVDGRLLDMEALRRRSTDVLPGPGRTLPGPGSGTAVR
ncbi:hypothetical protein [Streptomyces sp. NPDC000410]|uniref:hypothetical protein n=1 Tax=Streptomyces sp. NPDC000410 TaxID=3154254 RepID=UPI003326C9F0